ncbi:hypothetical protein [Brevibacterium aurantiacum]|uniref:hypothetical protein n=1 Tax=Brevibacterium aurantiacum TaxID=273384 RepID=UPI000F65257F|nr:hypothetical protein [Brevibacterium aurantiacum]AZL10557.1 hypothetical protein CXR26_16045 [Brevibacterium aurantiacum]
MTEQTTTETEEVEQDHIGGADKMVDEELSAKIGEKSDEGAISNPTPEGECPVDTTEGTEESDSPVGESDDEPDTFPREYVEKLRDENARYRQRASQADDLAAKLHTALVTATGRLMDPSDLEFDEAHLEDPEELTAAIDELLEAKPYLGKRTPKGDIGQGASGGSGTVNLVDIMRSQA